MTKYAKMISANKYMKVFYVFIIYSILALFTTARQIISYKYQGTLDHTDFIFHWNFTMWYVWALFTPIMYYIVKKYSSEVKSFIKISLILIPISIIIAIIYSEIVKYLFIINPIIDNRIASIINFQDSFFTCITIFIIIHTKLYHNKLNERELRQSQLEAKLAQANLQALKMQIHPHFLFNTLHAISALIHKDVKKAEKMIVLLGDLLRAALDSDCEQEISLKKELDILEPYLEIERTRFSDRLKILENIDPETLNAKVPSLLLQPIIENSIKHGISPRTSSGSVEIKTLRDNGKLYIEISDDGVGLKNNKELKLGIGLSNIKERLKNLYGEEQKLIFLNRKEGGFKVSISIPFKTSN